jgi:hypothetical protein
MEVVVAMYIIVSLFSWRNQGKPGKNRRSFEPDVCKIKARCVPTSDKALTETSVVVFP